MLKANRDYISFYPKKTIEKLDKSFWIEHVLCNKCQNICSSLRSKTYFFLSRVLTFSIKTDLMPSILLVYKRLSSLEMKDKIKFCKFATERQHG